MLPILEQDIPGLTAVLRGLDPHELRALTRAAAQLALRVAPVNDQRVDGALVALDSDASVVKLRAAEQLQLLVDELDDDAAAFQIELDRLQGDLALSERVSLLESEYSRAFGQARACEALVAALEPVIEDAVEGALYEANAAMDHAPAAIRSLVDAIADGVGNPVDTVANQMNLG